VPASKPTQKMLHEYLAAVNGDPTEEWEWTSVADYLRRLDGRAAVNVVYLVPHLAVRAEAMGAVARPASGGEIARMQSFVAQGMADGAAGLSTGLNYWPCSSATTEELIALCKPVAVAGGVYVTHLRDYRDQIVEALEEAATIGREAGLPVHVSHLNHRAAVVTPVIDRVRAEGVDLTFDLYPYLAGCTFLQQSLPNWVQQGSASLTSEFLRQPPVRERLVTELAASAIDWANYRISAVQTAPNKIYEGQNLPAAAALAGKPLPEFIVDLLVAEALAVSVVIFHTHRTEEDIETLMQHPAQMFGSDSILAGDSPHPRAFGTFPRCLGPYVRDRGVLSLKEAVHKMTEVPARRFGLKDRGALRPGLAADIVIFDPKTIGDRATYADPCQFPAGIEYVLVNGETVVDHGHHTGRTPGRALRPDFGQP
jgi:N-acyl-D-amino-acid deacylase